MHETSPVILKRNIYLVIHVINITWTRKKADRKRGMSFTELVWKVCLPGKKYNSAMYENNLIVFSHVRNIFSHIKTEYLSCDSRD